MHTPKKEAGCPLLGFGLDRGGATAPSVPKQVVRAQLAPGSNCPGPPISPARQGPGAIPAAVVSRPEPHDDAEKNGMQKQSATAMNGPPRSILRVSDGG
jgi:hypothetical protein